MATYTVSVHCPYCQSDGVVKNGTRSGKQLYRCQTCSKQFRDTGATNGHQVPAEQIGAAIEMFYRGMSYKQIAETMERMYDRPEPSKATIYEWVKEYTDKAAEELKDAKPEIGDEWVADEMAVKVGKWQMWNWNVMDAKTRFILASHLSRTRTQASANEVMKKAKAAAGRDPNTIKTDKLKVYRPAITKVFPKTLHLKSQGLTSTLNNNQSERLQGTYRSREKTLRGMDSMASGQRYLDGWTITYNFMRDHEALDGKTPAQAAKVKVPFNEWADVVKSGTTPQTFATNPQEAKLPSPKAGEKLKLPNIGPEKQSERAGPSTPPTALSFRPIRPKSDKRRNPKHHPFYQVREPKRRSTRKRR